MVEFDPRRAPFALVSAQHGPSKLQTRRSSARSSAICNLAEIEGMCELLHTGDVFFAEQLSRGEMGHRSVGMIDLYDSPAEGEGNSFIY
jgi:hypothetical protein